MSGKHDGRAWRQGFVPRYGCGTYVLVWFWAAVANLVFVLLGQWPSWSAGFAATAAGACFGSAVLAACNSHDRYHWDQRHGRDNGWTEEQHQRADDDEEGF